MNNKIYLIGFMASGKSTIGKELARQLGYKYVDTDNWIENQTGLKIFEIFATFGESHFRKLEKETTSQFLKEKDIVLSTGGGLPCFNNNIQKLKQMGTVVFLQCGFETSWKRIISQKNRPLGNTLSKNELKKLYTDRLSIYKQADFTVLSNRDIALIVKRIITLVNKKN
jgi:shikimate kinase